MNKKVKAPKGYHFMKDGKSYKLMKNKGKFVPHKEQVKPQNLK